MHETEYKGWRRMMISIDERIVLTPVLYIIYVVTNWYIYRSKRKNIKNKKKNLGKNTKRGFYTRTCKKLPPKLARPRGFSCYLKLRHIIKEEDFEGYSFITLLFIFKLKLLDIFGSCLMELMRMFFVACHSFESWYKYMTVESLGGA